MMLDVPVMTAFSSANPSSLARYLITAIPWCDNSMRIQIGLRNLPPFVAATQASLSSKLSNESLDELPGALIKSECAIGKPIPVGANGVTHGNLHVSINSAGLQLSAVDSGKIYFHALPTLGLPSVESAYLNASLVLIAGDKMERIYGLGQGGWTKDGGCPSGVQYRVPLERNGQVVKLQCVNCHRQ